jgi:3-deoxy-7-phosphoheptulonate synthase
LKTRHFGTIISELTSCLRIHSECGSRLGGVSLEFTGELNEAGYSVTECLGGSMELSEEQLGLRYQVVFCMLIPPGLFSSTIFRASAIPA